MKHIFISHSPRDARHMVTMRDNLALIGYRPWVDVNPRPGQDWRFDIDDAIRNADAVIVIVTPSAAESVYVTYEWSLAIGLGIPVIPVIFKEARMHPRLQTLEHYDFTTWADVGQFWDYFMQEIKRRLDIKPAPKPIQQPQVVAPKQMPQFKPVEPEPAPAFTRSIMPTKPGYYLVVRRGPKLNEMFRLSKPEITLGREDNNDITIIDPEVSRHHLKLSLRGDIYFIEDLGSTNGTRINGGNRIEQPTRLDPGQAVMLGDSIILSYEEIPA